MRLAMARGVLWFFGTIIFFAVFANDTFKKMSDVEAYSSLTVVGFVVGGVVFGYTWYEYEQEQLKLRNKERLENLKKGDGQSVE